jgi:glycosyltransferase involved in cell wall biosynthesis
VPTLNAGPILARCLKSIADQDVEHIEVIVADGGSSDGTQALAASFGATVIHNPDRIAEKGKQLALRHATGDFIVFMDSDNVLTHEDHFRNCAKELSDNPNLFGVESYYPAAPDMGSFCAYLTECLHISDPVSWMMARTPKCTWKNQGFEIWWFRKHSCAWPLGANGFVYRRADLENVNASQSFEDTVIAFKVSQFTRPWVRLTGKGVHHYTVNGLRDFIQKRRRQTFHWLSNRETKEIDWTTLNPSVPPFVAVLLCVTVVVPVLQMIWKLATTWDRRWLWHPVACVASVVGLAMGVLTWVRHRECRTIEASLQPRRS